MNRSVRMSVAVTRFRSGRWTCGVLVLLGLGLSLWAHGASAAPGSADVVAGAVVGRETSEDHAWIVRFPDGVHVPFDTVLTVRRRSTILGTVVVVAVHSDDSQVLVEPRNDLREEPQAGDIAFYVRSRPGERPGRLSAPPRPPVQSGSPPVATVVSSRAYASDSGYLRVDVTVRNEGDNPARQIVVKCSMRDFYNNVVAQEDRRFNNVQPHSEVTGTLFERDTVRYLSGFGDRVKIARRGRGNPITDTDLKVEASASR